MYNRALSSEEIQQLYTQDPQDTQPDAFQLGNQTEASPGKPISSNPITVSGISTPSPISISGGLYSINGSDFTDQVGTVNNGDQVQVVVTASSRYSTSVDAILNIGGISDTFTVTTQAPPADTTPDAFRFNDPTGVTPGQVVLSNAISVSGISAATPISLSGTGAAYSVNGGGFVTQPGTVNNGDVIQVRLSASARYSTPADATLTIGGISDTYTVTTQAPPADTTPDAFRFNDQTGVTPGQVVLSNAISVSGISAATPISLSGTGAAYSVNGGGFVTQPGTVNNGDVIQVRLSASARYSTSVGAILNIGGISDTFTVTTQAPPADTTPDAFRFNDLTGVTAGQVVLSNAITVSGISAATPISLSGTGAAYSVNGGGFVTQPGTVNNGDLVQIRVVAPSTPATTLTTTLNIGGVSDDFSVSTVGVVAPAADTTPDAFSFSPQTGVGLSATVTSNAVTLKGLNSPAAIRISGGLYSVNAGAFVSTAGTVKAGDAVTLQVNASAQYGQTVTATLNIGGVTGTFSVTTGSAPTVVSGVDLAQILAGQPVDLAPQASSGTSYGQAMAVQGDVLWMGAPAETSQGQKARGAVHVWQRTAGGVFQEQGLPLSLGKAGDGFGSRIVLTEAQAFVAAPKLDRDALVDIGQVYVYPLTGSNQPVQTLAAPQSYPKAAFGTALAQSDNWLAIGAPGVTKDDGRVYLYAFEQGQWVYRKVLMPIGKGSRFGASVAMSGDWLMVGAPKAQSNPDPKVKLRNGAVYAYRLHGDDWQAAPAGTLPLPDPDLFRTGELGTELSLAGDIFAVSAPFATVTSAMGINRTESGRVFMYSYDAGSQTWLRGSYLQLNPEHLIRSGARFGSTLQLSVEGHSLLVGAPLADQSPDIEGDNQLDVGRVYLYQLRNSGWAVARDRVGKSKFEQFGRTVLLGPNDVVIGNGKGTVWDYQGP